MRTTRKRRPPEKSRAEEHRAFFLIQPKLQVNTGRKEKEVYKRLLPQIEASLAIHRENEKAAMATGETRLAQNYNERAALCVERIEMCKLINKGVSINEAIETVLVGKQQAAATANAREALTRNANAATPEGRRRKPGKPRRPPEPTAVVLRFAPSREFITDAELHIRFIAAITHPQELFTYMDQYSLPRNAENFHKNDDRFTEDERKLISLSIDLKHEELNQIYAIGFWRVDEPGHDCHGLYVRIINYSQNARDQMLTVQKPDLTSARVSRLSLRYATRAEVKPHWPAFFGWDKSGETEPPPIVGKYFRVGEKGARPYRGQVGECIERDGNRVKLLFVENSTEHVFPLQVLEQAPDIPPIETIIEELRATPDRENFNQLLTRYWLDRDARPWIYAEKVWDELLRAVALTRSRLDALELALSGVPQRPAAADEEKPPEAAPASANDAPEESAAASPGAVVVEFVTLAEWQRYFNETVLLAETTAEQHREMFQRTLSSVTPLLKELEKLKVTKLARFCEMSSRDEKKPALVERALDKILRVFALGANVSGSHTSFMLSHANYEEEERKRKAERLERIIKAVAAVTDEDLQRHRRKVEEREQAEAEEEAKAQKAITNPETEREFDQFIFHHGMVALMKLKAEKKMPRKEDEKRAIIYREGVKAMDDAQLERYDEIQAAHSQERRAQKMIDRATIRRISIGDGNYMEIVRHHHGKRDVDQWIVVLAEREDRTTFEELCIAAHKLGGFYQRAYAPANSPGGFAFDDEKQAEKFVQLQSKDIFEMARLERLVANRERVRANAVEHFTGLAGKMEDRAHEELTRPRKENTERRLVQAENARDRAYDEIAMAGTLKSYAVQLQQQLNKHTDRIRWRTHAEALERLLDRAGHQMSKVEYPWPVVPVHALKEIADQIGERDGSILISQRVLKLCRATSGHAVRFAGDYAADTLRHFYRRARLHRVKGYALDAVREALGDFKRMRLNNLDTLPELRAALREHLKIRTARTELTRAEKVMMEMWEGRFPPDYFPTPPDVVALLLEYAQGEDWMRWLEPQAGSGHIANAIREAFPQARIDLIEISGLLCKALIAQDWSPLKADFLKVEREPVYDRIIANPPFGCDGTGTDIDLVLKMYSLLAPNGRLVSLMSDGVFYRGDHKAESFRAWLESVGGMHFEVTEGAFLNSDRPTSWATRIVVIDNVERVADAPGAVITESLDNQQLHSTAIN
jgi:hypothetical protein